MNASSGPPGTRDTLPGADRTVALVGYIVALLPVIVAGLVTLALPSFLEPFFDDRFAVAGVPAGPAILALVGGLVVLGVLVVWRFRSPLAIVAVVALCVMPALFIILFGPALILIAVNLWS